MLQGLGYVAKTGHKAQYGTFTYRGVELDTNPEVYRFKYQVQSMEDGLQYFDKVIKENLAKIKISSSSTRKGTMILVDGLGRIGSTRIRCINWPIHGH